MLHIIIDSILQQLLYTVYCLVVKCESIILLSLLGISIVFQKYGSAIADASAGWILETG